MPTPHDITFPCMGGDVRLLVQADARPAVDAASLAAGARRHLEHVDDRLSRFRPGSALCALNADPRPRVPAIPLLIAWVQAARWAAERTGGLVDPTLIGPLEAAGYADTRAGRAPATEALPTVMGRAPARRPARPCARSRWRLVEADPRTGTVTRPPGLRLDSGGTGKGFAADSAARVLAGAARYAVDCAGDIAVGGTARTPHEVGIEHPLTGEVAHVVQLTAGGIATSGIDRRRWTGADGLPAHHLLDPSTGAPAWTGLISATVIAGTVLEAETLAKAAVLGGPAAARRLLAGHAAVLVHDDGDVERLDAGRPRLVLRDRTAARAA